MSKHKSDSFGQEKLSLILVILVAGSISLAIANKENHAAYFDIVKIAMAYSFGSSNFHSRTKQLSNKEDAEENLQ